MTFRYSNHNNATDSRHPGNRTNNYAVMAAFGLISLVTWLAAGAGGSACLGGACMAAGLAQSSVPPASSDAAVIVKTLGSVGAERSSEFRSVRGEHEPETGSALFHWLDADGRNKRHGK